MKPVKNHRRKQRIGSNSVSSDVSPFPSITTSLKDQSMSSCKRFTYDGFLQIAEFIVATSGNEESLVLEKNPLLGSNRTHRHPAAFLHRLQL